MVFDVKHARWLETVLPEGLETVNPEGLETVIPAEAGIHWPGREPGFPPPRE
jgi:hypothetical protein